MRAFDVPVESGRFGATERTDRWWLPQLGVFAAFASFIVYANWAAWQGEYYRFGPYLSPFYSPELIGDPEHAWFGGKPSWYPAWLPFSPALLILWAPGGFRLTCYYYRGAYYKAFWADPPGCTVGEPRKKYLGERSFPLMLQNIHRYFMYLAMPFILVLGYDVWLATQFEDGFGIGLGTLILAANTVLLAGYVFGCHSLRHYVGGFLDRMSGHPGRRKAYDCVSCLNKNHMRWAWASLFSVAFSDVYVRLCSMGIWSDWRIL